MELNHSAAHASLQALVDRQLSAVVFVMDYVQLQFDELIITAYTMPEVTADGRTFHQDDDGYRDALCARIMQLLKSVDLTADQITMTFMDTSVISISLREADYVCPEAAEWSFEKGRIWVV